jgi:hypothetical protein
VRALVRLAPGGDRVGSPGVGGALGQRRRLRRQRRGVDRRLEANGIGGMGR